jgi:hypothetical protein
MICDIRGDFVGADLLCTLVGCLGSVVIALLIYYLGLAAIDTLAALAAGWKQ